MNTYVCVTAEMFQVALFLSKPSTRTWDTNGCAITIQRMYGDIHVVTTFSDIRTLVVVCLHATAYVRTYVLHLRRCNAVNMHSLLF